MTNRRRRPRGLRMSRWWDRNGRSAPHLRVLCYLKGRRRAYVWRIGRGRLAPLAYCVMHEAGATHTFGCWRDAFTAARAHVAPKLRRRKAARIVRFPVRPALRIPRLSPPFAPNVPPEAGAFPGWAVGLGHRAARAPWARTHSGVRFEPGTWPAPRSGARRNQP